MLESPAEVSPLALSILELLDERPMHPYELASKMKERHYDEVVRLNFGSLYHTVEILERHGWVVATEHAKEGRRPERTVYRLTPTGRGVMLEVVEDIVVRPRREYPAFSAGLMFMHHLGAGKAAGHLRARAAALKAVGDKLTRLTRELRERGVTRLSLIELEHKVALIEAERRWVSNLAREIDDGGLEWKAGGIDSGHERLRSGHGARTN
jgi:DNA-binding PadR family transcriptional regulator